MTRQRDHKAEYLRRRELKEQRSSEKHALLEQYDDRTLVEQLETRGWMVQKDALTERRINLSNKAEGRVRIAVASDTHLGSKYQQITHLQQFADTATKWGAEYAIHAGDLVDGSHKMHRGMEYEQFKLGADAQGRYAAKHFPKIANGDVPWHVIGGNHDGSFWNDAGANVLDTMAQRRPDIDFLGAPAAWFTIGQLRIYVLHPDGGPSYARSYKLQKLVEQLAPDQKPHIILCGHWHVPAYVPGYRNVEAMCLPCFQSQTPYLRRKGLAPVLGGLLLDVGWSKAGVEDVNVRWELYRTPIDSDY